MDSLASNDFYLLGLILLCPAVGALINGVFGRFFSRRVVAAIACTAIGLSFVIALISTSAFFGEARAIKSQVSQQAAAGEETDGATGEDDGVEAAAEGNLVGMFSSPTLEWTAFEWITSGDWTSGEGGFVPSTQFQVWDPRVYEVCALMTGGDKPAWASESVWQVQPCLSNVYTPNIRVPLSEDEAALAAAEGKPTESVEAQKGIGGVRARLQSGSHRFGEVKISMNFVVDALAGLLVLIITGVGFLIHIYSVGYMRHDKTPSRYFSYLNLFCFAMLILVMGGNMIVTFVGWEGVGLCSYLLIGYYYESHDNADAGKKAFIVNRVGDFAFVIGVLTLFFVFGTFDYQELGAIFSDASFSPETHTLLTIAAILIFIGCTGKSAQIPLYTWLPDAMAGPTPVSALIHAATMVTAGVYLISRLHFLYIDAPVAMMIVAFVGALTAIFAASIALVQNDIKKVLAYSTVSQLGYMFLAVGTGAFWVGVFHLMTHAFFKALLFLGSGSVIDALHHEQDIRKMGGLRKYMPITAITFFVACLAIAGVPLLSGFFSKDQILWAAWYNDFPTTGRWFSYMLWFMGTVTAGMTAFYMFRLYFLTFEGESRMDPEVEEQVSESPVSMTVPLTILAILAVVGGYVGLPHLLNFTGFAGFEALPKFLIPVITSSLPGYDMSHGTMIVQEIVLMSISVIVAGFGIFLAWRLYMKAGPEVPARIAEKNKGVYRLLQNKYYVDEIYDATVVRGTLAVARFSHKVIDVVLIDFLLVRGAAWFYELGGRVLRYFQNGDLQRYAAYIVLGIVAVLYLVML